MQQPTIGLVIFTWATTEPDLVEDGVSLTGITNTG